MLSVAFGLTAAVPQADAQAGVSVTPSTCYAVDETHDGDLDNHLIQVNIAADGTFSLVDLGLINNGAGVNTLNVESLAYRNGFTPRPLYTFDPSTASLIRISPTNGSDTVQVTTAGLGDIDGLTWRFDDDADPNNDELWGIIRNPGNADQIVGIDPVTGAIISGPTDIATNGTGQQNNVDGLAWDPTSGLFYAPVNGGQLVNDLITIDTSGNVTVVGSTGIQDIEGLGFNDAGDLFGTTGNAGPNMNELLFINKATGAATSLGPLMLFGDFESFDCAGVSPVAPTLQPSLEIRLTVIPDDGTTCAGSFAGGIDGVGPVLPVNAGDPVKYCFHVINNGPGDAFNVTVTHPLTGTTISLGDIPAGGQAMDMVSDVIEAGDGQSTATVNADDSAGDPIPQRDDPAAVAVNAPTSGVLATTPARTPFVPPAPAAAPAPAAPPLAVADTGAMGTTPTNGALPAGAAAPADEVLGVQQAAGATQPTELALTGVYSNLLAMFGFTLLGTGALMAGGDRRRRRNNES